MPIRTLLVTLVALIAGGRGASANFLAIGSNPTTELAVPFGLASDGAADPSNRYQQVFSSSLFRQGPIVISALSFFAQGPGAGGTFNQATYNFYLSTTQVAVGSLSQTNFGANVGANQAFFASVSPTGDAPSTWTITGSSLFTYNPLAGNLLLDVQVVGQRTDASFFGAAFDGQADYAGLSSSADNFGGNVAASGLSVGVTFNVVPEPSSVAMVVVGGGLALLAARRKAS